MSIIIPANSAVGGGFNVANSLRFNRGSSDSLSFTPNSTTNRRTFTISFWTKISEPNVGSVEYGIFNAGQQPNDNGWFNIQQGHTSDGDFMSQFYSGAFRNFKLTQKISDTNAWYHFVVAMDTTQGTNTNRLKYYINGTQVTSFNSPIYPDQNFDTKVSTDGQIQSIGSKRNGSAALVDHFDGYLSEFVMIDGQQLAPDQFGEFDEDSGIWKPIDVSGLTFGDNGYYLEFKQSGTSQNSSGLGADTSGNDNHFAVTNLTAIDQSTDTCTNNAVTFSKNNPSAANFTLSEGNLQISKSGTGQVGLYGSSIMLSEGKWYWEVKFTAVSGSDRTRAGVAAYESVTGTSTIQNSYSGFEFTSSTSGRFSITEAGSTTEVDGFNGFSEGDIIRFALDMDNTKLYVGRNGDWFNYSSSATGGNPASGSGYVTNSAVALAAPVTIYAGNSRPATGSAMELQFNFGATNTFSVSSGNQDANGYGNFEYAVPSGYFSLNTKNLAEYG
jgi:hypothetical protein